MRVLIACSISNNGGIGSKTVELAYQLQRSGCEVRAIYVHTLPDHDQTARTPHSFYRRLDVRKLNAEAKAFNPDVVLIAYSSELGLKTLFGQLGAPVVPIIHGQGVRFYQHAGVKRKFLRGLGARILKAYPHIIAINKDLEKTLLGMGVKKDRISVLPNGIDTATFRPRPAKKDFDLVFAGSLYKEKRLDVLFKAMCISKAGGRGPTLLVLGDGPMLTEYKALAKSMGVDATFAGWKKRPAGWYRRARAFVLSSEQEEFPSAPLEAMACAIPLITTKVGALAGLLRPGRDAMMVPPNDPAALAMAIDKVLGDPGLRLSLAQKGQEAAMAYGWDRVAPRYLGVLDFVAGPEEAI